MQASQLIQDARKYGLTGTTRADFNRVLDSLNRLTRQTIHTSFKELSDQLEQEIKTRTQTGVTRILFLGAGPQDWDTLKLKDEMKAIDDELRKAEFRSQFEFIPKQATRAPELQELFLRYKPRVVHFSGHGSSTNEIILEDESGRGRPVSTEALTSLTNYARETRSVGMWHSLCARDRKFPLGQIANAAPARG
ncbi:MAG: hypothetical protein HY741_14195 [Chloroflexi bacterium]|nr:hypothetical protein [Chloroflexota bacterium]